MYLRILHDVSGESIVKAISNWTLFLPPPTIPFKLAAYLVEKKAAEAMHLGIYFDIVTDNDWWLNFCLSSAFGILQSRVSCFNFDWLVLPYRCCTRKIWQRILSATFKIRRNTFIRRFYWHVPTLNYIITLCSRQCFRTRNFICIVTFSTQRLWWHIIWWSAYDVFIYILFTS